jgi:hypothetical protein
MGKVKDLQLKKKNAVERMLIDMWRNIGMDIPENFEVIVQDCYEDVCETADPKSWHSGDVAIAFRRWMEEQTQKQVDAMYEREQRTDMAVINTIRNIANMQAANVQDENVQPLAADNTSEPKPYFEIMKQGFDEELQREEIQIHGGENANIFLIKTDEGFVIDVYGQNLHIILIPITEDELCEEFNNKNY